MKLVLSLLPGNFAVSRFAPGFVPNPELLAERFVFTARTDDEFSLVCDAALLARFQLDPPKVEDGWRAFKVMGPLDFALVGIMARLAAALADAGISLFAVSTFDTDYVLVKAEVLDDALAALERADCEVRAEGSAR